MRSKAPERFLVATALAGWTVACLGQTTSTGIDPVAMAALDKMGAHLRTLKSFEVQSATTLDEVLTTGQKVQFGGTVDLKVRRPDRLRADIASDRKQRQIIYDGKTITLYGPRVKYYARVPAPATLGELVEVLVNKYGIELPLADLFYWGTDKVRAGDIKQADYLGPAKVDGATCDHYAFRQQNVDWQIWIQKGNAPLPRKLVITSIEDPSQPQYTSVLRWKPAAQLDDKTFAFVPPAGAQRIVLQTADGKVDAGSK